MTDFRLARENMVESQVRPNGITDRRIIDAMAAIAREDFVPAERRELAYLDEDIPIAASRDGNPARAMIEPMALARLIHLAAVQPTERALHIGAATGYGTMVLARLAASVVALECDRRLLPALRANVAACGNAQVVEGALENGHKEGAPYTMIFIEGRVGEVPAGLFAQLAHGGKLVAVCGETAMAKACVWTVTDTGQSCRAAFDASVAELPGFAKRRPAFVF